MDNIEKIKKQMLAHCKRNMTRMKHAPERLTDYIGFIGAWDLDDEFCETDRCKSNPFWGHYKQCTFKKRYVAFGPVHRLDGIVMYPKIANLYYKDSDKLYIYRGISNTEAEIFIFDFNVEETIYQYYNIKGLFSQLDKISSDYHDDENSVDIAKDTNTKWISEHYTETTLSFDKSIAEFIDDLKSCF